MSFLDITTQQTTGLQIKSWIDSLHSGIDSAKANYDNIANWKLTAQGNPDYSDADFLAVDIKLAEAVVKIKSLLPNEVI